MRRAARWGTLAVPLVLVASGSAHAADDRATREAEARFAEGLTAVKSKDFESARLSFAQAYAVLQKPLILWNLALSEEKSGHTIDAIGHFRQVTRDMPGAAEGNGAQKHLDALVAKMGRIEVQAPAGSTFTLDGGDVAGSAPLVDPIDVQPGHHVIEARFAHGGTKASQVDAVAGQIAHVSLVPADVPMPAQAGVPVAPAPAATEAQGTDVAPSDRAPSSRSVPTGKIAMTVVLGGAAAAAVGVGAYFGLQSRSNANVANGYRAETKGDSACSGSMTPSYCAAWDSAVQAQNRDATASNVLYVAGGVFALSAVMSWVLWPKGDRSVSAWVLPEVGPAGVGVGAGGRF